MRLPHFLLALFIVALWGINFVVIKLGLQQSTPIALCAFRFFFASLPAVFFIKPPSVPFKMVALYGFVMFVLQFSLMFFGLYAGMTAGLASLLLQLNVFFTVLLAVPFLGEKLNRWQMIGSLLSFFGIAIIWRNVGGDVTILGFVLLIAAAACWGSGNLISKKMGKTNMLSVVVWGSLIAWPMLLVTSLLFEGIPSFVATIQNASWSSVGILFYLVYPTTLLGFGVWNWLMSQYPVSTVAPMTLMVPIFGMLSSSIILGEALTSWKIEAGIFVLTGLGINLLGSRLMRMRLESEVELIEPEPATE